MRNLRPNVACVAWDTPPPSPERAAEEKAAAEKAAAEKKAAEEKAAADKAAAEKAVTENRPSTRPQTGGNGEEMKLHFKTYMFSFFTRIEPGSSTLVQNPPKEFRSAIFFVDKFVDPSLCLVHGQAMARPGSGPLAAGPSTAAITSPKNVPLRKSVDNSTPNEHFLLIFLDFAMCL